MPSAPREINFSIQHLERIVAHLKQMRRETNAYCVLLADQNGQLIESVAGDDAPNTDEISVLAAGELAATREIARMLGETRFQFLLHEGERKNIYLSDVSGEMMLITVFNRKAPIGLVRLWTRNISEQLDHIILEARTETQNNQELNDAFGQLVLDRLDHSFWQ
jgi:predicted regulator of Ras-like GTPase activity (Roadblock/LC7/MglB family)